MYKQVGKFRWEHFLKITLPSTKLKMSSHLNYLELHLRYFLPLSMSKAISQSEAFVNPELTGLYVSLTERWGQGPQLGEQ